MTWYRWEVEEDQTDWSNFILEGWNGDGEMVMAPIYIAFGDARGLIDKRRSINRRTISLWVTQDLDGELKLTQSLPWTHYAQWIPEAFDNGFVRKWTRWIYVQNPLHTKLDQGRMESGIAEFQWQWGFQMIKVVWFNNYIGTASWKIWCRKLPFRNPNHEPSTGIVMVDDRFGKISYPNVNQHQSRYIPTLTWSENS